MTVGQFLYGAMMFELPQVDVRGIRVRSAVAEPSPQSTLTKIQHHHNRSTSVLLTLQHEFKIASISSENLARLNTSKTDVLYLPKATSSI